MSWGGATVVCQGAEVNFQGSFCGSPRKSSLGYKVIGCSRRRNNAYGACAGKISTTGAVGNNGVGDVEGGASICVNAAAAGVSSIAREGGIVDENGSTVEDADAPT